VNLISPKLTQVDTPGKQPDHAFVMFPNDVNACSELADHQWKCGVRSIEMTHEPEKNDCFYRVKGSASAKWHSPFGLVMRFGSRFVFGEQEVRRLVFVVRGPPFKEYLE
jgi:hypothetical protein